MTTGILKVHLVTLERSAETLERIVYNALVELETITPQEAAGLEKRILRKLEKLDDLQDEIDAVIARLKQAGEWEQADHSRNLYQYSAPISKHTEAHKPAPWATKEYRAQRSARVDTHWQAVSEHMKCHDGTITTMDCYELLDISRAHSHGLVRRWAEEGKLKPSHKTGKTVVYRVA